MRFGFGVKFESLLGFGCRVRGLRLGNLCGFGRVYVEGLGFF